MGLSLAPHCLPSPSSCCSQRSLFPLGCAMGKINLSPQLRDGSTGTTREKGHSGTLSELNDTAVANTVPCSSCCLSCWSWHQNIFHKKRTLLSCLQVSCDDFFFFNGGKTELLWVKYSLGHGYNYCMKQFPLWCGRHCWRSGSRNSHTREHPQHNLSLLSRILRLCSGGCLGVAFCCKQ